MDISAVKGVSDVMPPEIHVWRHIENTAMAVFGAYGFMEYRPPVIEYTQVFTRSIGETSDIVEKEMYTFTDKGDRSVTLRPEGTAPIVRGYVQHNLHTLPSPQKYFYMGPMFRYERPQKGRQRQFYQIGAEAFGSASALMDAEIISMLRRFLEAAGLKDIAVQLNSIGCPACRPSYRAALVGFLSPKTKDMCPDCLRRYERNPLRILDCKAHGCVELRKGAPKVGDHLCDACKAHFSALKESLGLLGVKYEINPEMVRGLDYYTRTTFEVTSMNLGAQNAVAAGGRYDGLVREFGGPETPAVGFAVGMERLVSLISKESSDGRMPRPSVYIASIGEAASRRAAMAADNLRAGGLWAETSVEGGSLKAQLRRADRLGARHVFILGDEELSKGSVKWKDMRNKTEGELPMSGMADFLRSAP